MSSFANKKERNWPFLTHFLLVFDQGLEWERPASQPTQAQGRWPSYGPAVLPSLGSWAGGPAPGLAIRPSFLHSSFSFFRGIGGLFEGLGLSF